MLIPSSVFFFSVIVFFRSDWFFFILFIYLFYISFNSFYSQVQRASLWSLLLNLYLEECLSLFCLVLFLGFVLFFFLENISLSHYACVCFCVLGKSATYPSFERVVFGPQRLNPHSHQSQVFQGLLLCGLSVPFCCGWAITAVGVLLNGVGSKTDYLQGPAATMDAMVGEAGPPEWEPLWRGTDSGWGSPLGVVGWGAFWKGAGPGGTSGKY